MPEDMPEDMTEHIAEDMPGRMPEDMQDRMPEDLPERMPEDMSDRMPVTKRINVMVGITRSKVIVFWAPMFTVELQELDLVVKQSDPWLKP
jgi:hypothetical protein